MPKLIFRSNYWGNEPAVLEQSFNKGLGNTKSQNQAFSDSKLKTKEKHKAVSLGQKADDSEDNENRKAAIDMQEYNYSDIVKIDKFGIEFNDKLSPKEWTVESWADLVLGQFKVDLKS